MSRLVIKRDGVFSKEFTPFLFVLTDQQRAALLSLTDIFFYKKTWVNQVGDFVSLSDAESAVLEDLVYRLMEVENVDEIVAAIDGLKSSMEARDLQDELRDIRAAIASGGNCNSCGGELEPEPVGDPGDPDIDPTPDDPDFPTWGDYDDYKCKAANFTIDNLTEAFRRLEADKVGELAAAGIAAVTSALSFILSGSSVVVAGVAISSGVLLGIGLLAALAVLIVTNAGWDAQNVYQALIANHDDLVCELYGAGDADLAGDAVNDLLDATGLLTAIELQIVSLLLTTHDLNRLFELDQTLDDSGYEGTYDCLGCDTVNCGDFVIAKGALVSGSLASGTQQMVIQSAHDDAAGCAREQVTLYFPDGCGQNILVNLTTNGFVAGLDCAAEFGTREVFGGGFVEYDYANGQYCSYGIYVRSVNGNAFTLTVDVLEVC